jgi:hypothetical protein
MQGMNSALLEPLAQSHQTIPACLRFSRASRYASISSMALHVQQIACKLIDLRRNRRGYSWFPHEAAAFSSGIRC